MSELETKSSQERASATPTQPKSVYVKTFGCQMNEYDSEKMYQLLSPTHQAADDIEQADLVLVNTCSVREKGEHKLFSLLGSLRDLKRERPELMIGVGGCVAQQEGQNIVKRFPTVDFVVGTHNLSLIPSLVRQVEEGRGAQVAIDYREDWETLPENVENLPTPSKIRALIAIQRGCNKNCAFCVVPTTRGPEVSRSAEEIEREVRIKTRMGAKELLLLGQTVNSYGKDLTPRVHFEELIGRIAKIDGVKRIRFTSPHPAEVRPAFLDLYKSIPQLCPHLHLPLQSGSDRILKLMNRNYRRRRYLEIIAEVRERCPAIALTTDVIVGFPSETQEDFEQTLEMVREVGYHFIYAFKYSRRPNTVAAEKFAASEEVPANVAQERLQRLFDIQDEMSAKLNARLLGKTVEVLVDEPAPGVSSSNRGRIPENTLVELISDSALTPGQLVQAKVSHTSAYGLRGEVLSA